MSISENTQINKPDTIIQIGCNYHTTWQKHRNMRFVLKEVKGDKARLITRNTKKDFWTNISDLIFIDTNCNRNKLNNYERIQNRSGL